MGNMSQSFILWGMSLRYSLLWGEYLRVHCDGQCMSELYIIGSVSANSNQFCVPSFIICN